MEEFVRNLAQIRRRSAGKSASPRLKSEVLVGFGKFWYPLSRFWVPFLQKNFVPSLLTPKRSEGGGKKSGALLRLSGMLWAALTV